MHEVELWRYAFPALECNIDFVAETGLCVCAIKLFDKIIKCADYLDDSFGFDYIHISDRGDQVACEMLFHITGNLFRKA
jgi:hypothetical protein